MGWHDVTVMISGGDLISDVCRHFIQRWIFTKADVLSKTKSNPCLLPHTMGVTVAGPSLSVEGILSSLPELKNATIDVVNGQLLRSAYRSSGLNVRDRSIYNAMLHLIESAR